MLVQTAVALRVPMSDIGHKTSMAAVGSAAKPLIRRIWARAIFGIGVGLTVAWVCFLGYGLVALTKLVI